MCISILTPYGPSCSSDISTHWLLTWLCSAEVLLKTNIKAWQNKSKVSLKMVLGSVTHSQSHMWPSSPVSCLQNGAYCNVDIVISSHIPSQNFSLCHILLRFWALYHIQPNLCWTLSKHLTSSFTCSLLFAAWASPHASSLVSNALIPTTQEYGYIQEWSNMLISQWFSKTPKGSYFFFKLFFGPAHEYKLFYLKEALGMHQEYISRNNLLLFHWYCKHLNQEVSSYHFNSELATIIILE